MITMVFYGGWGWVSTVGSVVTQIATLICARFISDNLVQPNPNSPISPQELGHTFYGSNQKTRPMWGIPSYKVLKWRWGENLMDNLRLYHLH